MYSVYFSLQAYQFRLRRYHHHDIDLLETGWRKIVNWRTGSLAVCIICASQAKPQREIGSGSRPFLGSSMELSVVRLFTPHRTSSSHNFTKTSTCRHAKRSSTNRTYVSPTSRNMEESSKLSASPKPYCLFCCSRIGLKSNV
jgi:hypothetical protein